MREDGNRGNLINYQKEVESLFRQIDVKCDSIDKLMKEDKE